MTIKNLKKDASDVKVEVFRNKENSTTMYELFTTERTSLTKDGDSFVFNNFPISEKAKKLKVVITWKEDGSNRKYQETFVFKQE